MGARRGSGGRGKGRGGHVSWPARPGDRAGVPGCAGGVQGAGDLLLFQAGLAGGGGQGGGEVGGRGQRPGRGWRPRTGRRCGCLAAGWRPTGPGGSGHDFSTQRMRLEKRGDFLLPVSFRRKRRTAPAGASIRVPFKEPFYAGIGMCAHDKDVVETGVFSNVEVSQAPTLQRRTSHALQYAGNHGGHLQRSPHYLRCFRSLRSAELDARRQYVDFQQRRPPTPHAGCWRAGPESSTRTSRRCNNDHGFSPDSSLLAISDQSQGDHKSLVYLLPAAAGRRSASRRNSPSYWHGWSPDGQDARVRRRAQRRI